MKDMGNLIDKEKLLEILNASNENEAKNIIGCVDANDSNELNASIIRRSMLNQIINLINSGSVDAEDTKSENTASSYVVDFSE